MIAALSKHLQLPLGPLEAEAMAMDGVVSFAWEIGVRDVVFETNSSRVSNALNGSTTPLITMANLIVDTQHRIQGFRMTHIQHIKRQRNKPTLFLAKHAKGTTNFVTWDRGKFTHY